MDTSYAYFNQEIPYRRPSYYSLLAPSDPVEFSSCIQSSPTESIYSLSSESTSNFSEAPFSTNSSFSRQETPALQHSSGPMNSLFKQTTRHTEFTVGTSLHLTSNENSQVSFKDFEIARNILEDFASQYSSGTSTQDLGVFQPTMSMARIGLERRAVIAKNANKPKRYPQRNKTSPVKWWLGERTVHNEFGLLIAKDIRR